MTTDSPLRTNTLGNRSGGLLWSKLGLSSFLGVLLLACSGNASAQPTTKDASVHILFTSDLSGRFAWPGCNEDVTSRATIANVISAVQDRTNDIITTEGIRPVVVSAGSLIRPDLMGTASFGDASLAPIAADLLDAVGFHGIALGAFDLAAPGPTLRRFLALMHEKNAPLLAGNLHCHSDTDQRCSAIKRPYVILKRGTVRVGILSVLRSDILQHLPGDTSDGLLVANAVESARHHIRVLREVEKVDLVILLANVNTEADTPSPVLELSRGLDISPPDLIVTNAMFEANRENYLARVERAYGPPIVSTDRFGQTLGEAIFTFDAAASFSGPRLQAVHRHYTNTFLPDPPSEKHVRALKKTLCDRFDKAIENVKLKRPLSRSDFIAYLLSVLRVTAEAEIAVLSDTTFSSSGFPLTETLTLENTMRAIRYDAELVTASFRGSELKTHFGAYTEDTPGLRILGLERRGGDLFVNGRVLIDTHTYSVVTTRFLADGGEGLIAPISEVEPLQSGLTLRDSLLHFLSKERPRRQPPSPISLEEDFPRLDRNWVLWGIAKAGIGVNNVTVSNGPNGDRYSLPLLKRADLTSFEANFRFDFEANAYDHAFQSQLQLQHGRTWTTPQDTDETIEAETIDRILASFIYRLRAIRNAYGPDEFYWPEPFAEALVTSEFTPSGSFVNSGRCNRDLSLPRFGIDGRRGYFADPSVVYQGRLCDAGRTFYPE